MAKKKNNKLTIDEYINISKGDITIYVIMTIILLAISIYFAIKYNLYLLILLVGLIMIGRTYERIDTHLNLTKIKNYLIDKNLLDQIGNIDYWNDRYYLLSDNYMIIKQKKEIHSFKYSEIEKIYKESYLRRRYPQEYLHIVVNGNDFKVLIATTILVGEDIRDITDYLLKKNPHIEVNKPINNFNFNMFRH